MFWIKRRFTFADYAPYMDRLHALLMANAPLYPQFIMVSTDTSEPGVGDYYVGLPHKSLSVGFDGFEEVSEADLPREIDTVHIADQTKEEFARRFKMKPFPRRRL